MQNMEVLTLFLLCTLAVFMNSRGANATSALRNLVKRQSNEHDHRWKKEDFPSPANNFSVCGYDFICDPANILTSQQGMFCNLRLNRLHMEIWI